MRTQEKLLPFNEPDSLGFYPDELQFFLAVGADRPDVIWRFLNIELLRHTLSPLPNFDYTTAGSLNPAAESVVLLIESYSLAIARFLEKRISGSFIASRITS